MKLKEEFYISAITTLNVIIVTYLFFIKNISYLITYYLAWALIIIIPARLLFNTNYKDIFIIGILLFPFEYLIYYITAYGCSHGNCFYILSNSLFVKINALAFSWYAFGLLIVCLYIKKLIAPDRVELPFSSS